jgi:hypothetical protein
MIMEVAAVSEWETFLIGVQFIVLEMQLETNLNLGLNIFLQTFFNLIHLKVFVSGF